MKTQNAVKRKIDITEPSLHAQSEKIVGKYYQGNKIMVGSGIRLEFYKIAVKTYKGDIKLDSIRGKSTRVFSVLPNIKILS